MNNFYNCIQCGKFMYQQVILKKNTCWCYKSCVYGSCFDLLSNFTENKSIDTDHISTSSISNKQQCIIAVSNALKVHANLDEHIIDNNLLNLIAEFVDYTTLSDIIKNNIPVFNCIVARISTVIKNSTIQNWELIYRATRDGFNAHAFHKYCDNEKPTLTVALLVDKEKNIDVIVGAFTSKKWSSPVSITGIYDETAFTFTNEHDHIRFENEDSNRYEFYDDKYWIDMSIIKKDPHRTYYCDESRDIEYTYDYNPEYCNVFSHAETGPHVLNNVFFDKRPGYSIYSRRKCNFVIKEIEVFAISGKILNSYNL